MSDLAKDNQTLVENQNTYFQTDEWRGANAATIIADKLALVPIRSKIILLEDKFKTGYECSFCDGSGASKEVCSLCKGTKKEFIGTDSEDRCRACTVGSRENQITFGFKPCENCNGLGTRGGLIVPEKSERRPTSGKILAAGPFCKYFKIGDHVLYGNYAGYAITFKQQCTIRIMDEEEVMALMYIAKFNMNEAEQI